ncbi:MAG: glycosyltransferase, partial [Endomicrobiaceae bacterium]
MNNIFYDFSVLMSVYGKDNPLLIQEAVESILKQTVQPSELLVAVDGPVSKEITSLLEKYKKDINNFKIIYFEKNQGRGVVLQKV